MAVVCLPHKDHTFSRRMTLLLRAVQGYFVDGHSETLSAVALCC